MRFTIVTLISVFKEEERMKDTDTDGDVILLLIRNAWFRDVEREPIGI